MNNLPVVAVSSCLLGHSVRYDGKDKYARLLVGELKKHCQIIAVCPEVEIGLGVPRAKIQLTQVGSVIKVLKTDDLNVDVATDLTRFASDFVKQHSLSGLVLQDKSPSCGIDNVKLYSEEGTQIGLGSGVFATTVMKLSPNLVVVQASQLQSIAEINLFLKRLV